MPLSAWSLWRSTLRPRDTWAPFVLTAKRLGPPTACLMVPRRYWGIMRGHFLPFTPFALTAGAPSLPTLRDREERREALFRRRAGQPRLHKSASPATRSFISDVTRACLGSEALPPALAEALVDTKSGPTWDRYVAVIRPWFTYAAAASSPALPADPATFAAWLAAAGAQDRGYAQTKTRCVAISALCALVGAPSPEAHHLVRAYRTAARRNKRFRRGSVTPLFRSELPLPPTEPPQGAPKLARRAGLSPDERLCQRAATARHMALMHDAALRFDDTREGQLGNILHSPDVVEINIFGSKTDPFLRGQVASCRRVASGPLDRSHGHVARRYPVAGPPALWPGSPGTHIAILRAMAIGASSRRLRPFTVARTCSTH